MNTRDEQYIVNFESDPGLVRGNVQYFCYEEIDADVLIDLGENFYDPGTTVEYSFTHIPFVPPPVIAEFESGPRKITSLDATKLQALIYLCLFAYF